ncbi:2-polyprenylphenol 6-hydroxylase [Maritalea sp.]|uniref:2-polyprenylphenol 6-hydroxylase n=1 Tax=Maritalea sp. TaxID=2003361 RepID=UPI003EF1CA51
MKLFAYLRLVRAGYVLAREGALSLTEGQGITGPAANAIWFARLIERRSVRKTGRVERLSAALQKLGPTYVKLGQVLATRPDIVGATASGDLANLQDKMPPFDQKLVPAILNEALGDSAAMLTEMTGPIAAASIAQVHQAQLIKDDGKKQLVAVKLLRPDVERRFKKDLESLKAAAGFFERVSPKAKRLRAKGIVDTLERSALLELNLRMEAAAISELAENIKDDEGFEIPTVHWSQTGRTVMTTSWMDGIAIRDHDAIEKAGIDRKKVAKELMQHFLRHAIRDGFFHADMHPGNLFVDPKSGNVRAVDFGIMGRIGKQEQKFLAEILYGFITRNYHRIAQLHFDIGYVPSTQSVDDFAQALRAIGEPLVGRPASEISMAKVLTQLLDTTELFDMQTRTELVMLQKNMVLVEGVARSLDPELNMWEVAEPIVSTWVKRNLGPIGIAEEARDTGLALWGAAKKVPDLIERYETLLDEAEKQRAQTPFFMQQWFGVLAVALMLSIGVAAIKTLF